MRVRELWQLLKDTCRAWYQDNISQQGAALAFYAVFAVAPLVIIAVAIAGMVFGQQAALSEVSKQIEEAFGSTVAAAIEELVKQIHQSGSGVVATVLSVIVLLIGAAGLFGQLQQSLNAIWKVKPRPDRGWVVTIKDRLLPYLMVLVIGWLLLLSLLANSVLAVLGNAVAEIWLVGSPALPKALSWLVTIGLVSFLFALIYKILPDVKIRWSDVWIGAILTALLFTIGNHLIGLYLAWSGVATVYGAAGSLVVILLWVYYSSQVLLLGAEFTHVYSIHWGYRPQPTANAIADMPETGALEQDAITAARR